MSKSKYKDAILEAAKTAASLADAARMVGCPQSRVRDILNRYAPDLHEALVARHAAKLQSDTKKALILRIAPASPSISHIAKLAHCRNDYVENLLRRFAPDEYERLTPRRAEGPIGKPVCWTSRAHALFPDDEALARSLARAASFVSKTRDGVTVRLVPPRSEGQVA